MFNHAYTYTLLFLCIVSLEYDYEMVYEEFTFSSSSVAGDTHCVNISRINDDTIVEDTEFFTLVLYSDDSAVKLINNSVQIHIKDNDGT